ncbi:Phenylacetic acid catabolic protein [Paenibacillus sp. UMB4589-SE434]|uniref:Phenylacetic acid catabolic protein n=1 Tax=Paenibacillus sp. UMB4589-SE434 TaxID=3046314 RepID=UPI00254B62E9|nr:Phenylacetic acid catabolic protein [Paenibacillus sp. UMB4589-SE434]MDK8182743.1 phenylacetate-CoA oxygenase subunit PaaI [Paenibacillus sp. UMB4589-SE434]
MDVQATSTRILLFNANNLVLLGDKFATVGISAPSLEATLCSISIAQAHLGHARFFYRLCEQVNITYPCTDTTELDGSLKTIYEINDWVQLMTISIAFHLAMETMLELEVNVNLLVKGKIEKLRKEQKQYMEYLSSWVVILHQDHENIRCLLLDAYSTFKIEIRHIFNWLVEDADCCNDILSIFEQKFHTILSASKVA